MKTAEEIVADFHEAVANAVLARPEERFEFDRKLEIRRAALVALLQSGEKLRHLTARDWVAWFAEYDATCAAYDAAREGCEGEK